MKYLLLLLFFYFIQDSCTEVAVTLPVPQPGTGNTLTQNVLIEEYTGVRCQNCPAGAQLLEELKTIHGNRLTILSIHGGFFAQPANKENKLKLDNAFGQQLINVFNQPQGYPSAMIDRKIFDGQYSLFLGGSYWAGYIEQEKNKIPAVGIELSSVVDNSTRMASFNITIRGLADLSSQPLWLSVALAENDIKDAQLTPVGIDTNYVHRHVMRTFISAVLGNAINPVTAGSIKTYNLTSIIPADWNLDQLYTIAFVHKGGANYEVIQVTEKKLN